jgi:hypothetical protein
MVTLGYAAGVTTAGEQRAAACSHICVLAPAGVLKFGNMSYQVKKR